MRWYQLAELISLGLIWALLSFGELFKLGGPRGGWLLSAVLPIGGAAVLFWLLRARPSAARRTIAMAMALIGMFAATAYFVLHPLSERHVFGPGSDREDALRRGCQLLLHGHYPYRQMTFLHDPITPLPGAMIFAAPFYWMGQIGLQNLFWLAALLVLLYRLFEARWVGVWFVGFFLLLNPCIMQDVVTGGDFFINLVYVTVLASAVIYVHRRSAGRLLVWILPLVLGVALSSRPLYSILYPCVLAYVAQLSGTRAAMRTGVLMVAAQLAVTLPLYLRDPAHFTPLTAGGAAYAIVPAALHPAALLLAVGLLISASGFFVAMSMRNAVAIAAAALNAVTLPLFFADRIVSPAAFPLTNLIYLSPGLFFAALWLTLRAESSFAVPRAAPTL